MKKLITLLVLSFVIFTANATHIVGGYIRSQYLGNNLYKINLVVYRDCFNGVPPFDEPARLGVYGNNGLLVSSLDVFTFDSVSVAIQGDCIPGNICIRVAYYDTTISLPPQQGFYTVAYQRCCRSGAVLNLFDPLNFGMTFYTTINTMAQNSTIQFKHEFASFTFVGDNFSFDASAIDSDGDSLVYSLDNALDGASTADPAPLVPAAPPYTDLLWQMPFSINDILGGIQPLTIDPVTGLMTAIPGNIGVFCIPYKVDEYRNGILINTNRKEMVIAVNPPTYFDVAGMVFANNGSQFLDEGNAWLIRLNLIDSILTATDTNLISSGNYQFPTVINGVYLLKASASSISSFYPNNIPTYYGDVLFWHQAQEVELCTVNAPNVDITMVQGVNPGGPGFVGGLISLGANRFGSEATLSTNEGTMVILFNQASEPVAYATTDASGNFSIGNIPLGTYSVYIDRLNFLVDNSIAPQITLTSINPSANNLAFTLHPTWLELNGFVGLSEPQISNSSLTVYPNPVAENLILQHNNESISGLNYYIYNLLGEEVQTGKVTDKSVNIHSLTNQIFILKLETKSGNKFVRFVKM